MGYDFWLEIDTGGPWPARVAEPDAGNYTFNVSPMFAKALDSETGPNWALYVLNGMKAGDALPRLREGVRRMEEEPDVYRAMNPENGWGDYDGALRVLRSFVAECSLHPLATIHVS